MTEMPYAIGPMAKLYDHVLQLVERGYDTSTRERFAAWLRAQTPTTAHLAVMSVEMGLSGTGDQKARFSLVGFTPDGEPLLR